MEEFEKASCIQGFHVYQDNFTPILGERLVCKNELGNPRDWYAVAVCKAGDEIHVVGHLPRNISTMCSIFIWHGGIIYCTVSGSKNSLENFCDWRLIHENCKSFPPQTICIIWYMYVATFTWGLCLITVVWEKFTVGYFCVKKYFHLLEYPRKIFNKVFYGQTFCPIAHELNAQLYITMHSFNVHFTQAQTHNDNRV